MSVPVYRVLDLSAIAALDAARRPVRIPVDRRPSVVEACALLTAANGMSDEVRRAAECRVEEMEAAARIKADEIIDAAYERAGLLAEEFEAELARAHEQFVEEAIRHCSPVLAGIVAEAIREVLGQVEIEHLASAAVARLLESESARLSAATLHIAQDCRQACLPELPVRWQLGEPLTTRTETTLRSDQGSITVSIREPAHARALETGGADGGMADGEALSFLDMEYPTTRS